MGFWQLLILSLYLWLKDFIMRLRKAEHSELGIIWEIIQFAIDTRRKDGSKQWQDGYPNLSSIEDDIDRGYAYVIEHDECVVLYAAIIFDGEPAYEKLEGNWLTNEHYVVLHRVAISKTFRGKGVAQQFFQMVEALCLEKNIYSIKVDTNFDNLAMLRILEKLNYSYCGEVYFRGEARKAFEKILDRKSICKSNEK